MSKIIKTYVAKELFKQYPHLKATLKPILLQLGELADSLQLTDDFQTKFLAIYNSNEGKALRAQLGDNDKAIQQLLSECLEVMKDYLNSRDCRNPNRYKRQSLRFLGWDLPAAFGTQVVATPWLIKINLILDSLIENANISKQSNTKNNALFLPKLPLTNTPILAGLAYLPRVAAQQEETTFNSETQIAIFDAVINSNYPFYQSPLIMAIVVTVRQLSSYEDVIHSTVGKFRLGLSLTAALQFFSTFLFLVPRSLATNFYAFLLGSYIGKKFGGGDLYWYLVGSAAALSPLYAATDKMYSILGLYGVQALVIQMLAESLLPKELEFQSEQREITSYQKRKIAARYPSPRLSKYFADLLQIQLPFEILFFAICSVINQLDGNIDEFDFKKKVALTICALGLPLLPTSENQQQLKVVLQRYCGIVAAWAFDLYREGTISESQFRVIATVTHFYPIVFHERAVSAYEKQMPTFWRQISNEENLAQQEEFNREKAEAERLKAENEKQKEDQQNQERETKQAKFRNSAVKKINQSFQDKKINVEVSCSKDNKFTIKLIPNNDKPYQINIQNENTIYPISEAGFRNKLAEQIVCIYKAQGKTKAFRLIKCESLLELTMIFKVTDLSNQHINSGIMVLETALANTLELYHKLSQAVADAKAQDDATQRVLGDQFKELSSRLPLIFQKLENLRSKILSHNAFPDDDIADKLHEFEKLQADIEVENERDQQNPTQDNIDKLHNQIKELVTLQSELEGIKQQLEMPAEKRLDVDEEKAVIPVSFAGAAFPAAGDYKQIPAAKFSPPKLVSKHGLMVRSAPPSHDFKNPMSSRSGGAPAVRFEVTNGREEYFVNQKPHLNSAVDHLIKLNEIITPQVLDAKQNQQSVGDDFKKYSLLYQLMCFFREMSACRVSAEQLDGGVNNEIIYGVRNALVHWSWLANDLVSVEKTSELVVKEFSLKLQSMRQRNRNEFALNDAKRSDLNALSPKLESLSQRPLAVFKIDTNGFCRSLGLSEAKIDKSKYEKITDEHFKKLEEFLTGIDQHKNDPALKNGYLNNLRMICLFIWEIGKNNSSLFNRAVANKLRELRNIIAHEIKPADEKKIIAICGKLLALRKTPVNSQAAAYGAAGLLPAPRTVAPAAQRDLVDVRGIAPHAPKP